MKKFFTIAAVISLFVFAAAVTADQIITGNHWREFNDKQKACYLIGLLEGSGMELALISNTIGGECKGAIESYIKAKEKIFADITYDQYMSGLDELYEEDQNRNIPVVGAILIITEEINGSPEDKIEKR